MSAVPTVTDVLPVWRGHRGDGEIAVRVGGAADDAHLEEVMQGTHDQLVDQLAARRAGPVTWFVYGPSQAESRNTGVELCRLMQLDLGEGLHRFLDANPGSTLVLAMAPTDRISRRTPPRRKGRQR